jgi:hypothetical protein
MLHLPHDCKLRYLKLCSLGFIARNTFKAGGLQIRSETRCRTSRDLLVADVWASRYTRQWLVSVTYYTESSSSKSPHPPFQQQQQHVWTWTRRWTHRWRARVASVEKGENEAANLGSPSVPCCLIWSSNRAQDYRGRRLVSDLIFKYKETISISRKISYPNQPARYKSTRDIQLGLQDIYSI